ncbi:kinetochore-associated protein DSN1 homolog [Mastacembelus armatus]|uniref:DSN1 component of MIS12 kinetochore complex n=1 Tax=Mastacembelus armatus TaxID=205130 RepID=A0A3Q3STC6_9TELE|nr:uncharacterized protein LOC113141125 [Mastacembelus armatus]
MAEKHLESVQDSVESLVVTDNQNEVNSGKQTSKRCSSTSSSTAPPQKSSRTDLPSPTPETPDSEVTLRSKADKQEMQTEDTEGASSPSVGRAERRKSWRRATITRRSLPALPNPYHVLCREISTSLSQQERLEKLMEASMRLALERTQNSLQSVPNTSMESFQKQVEHVQKVWGCLAKSIHSKLQDDQHPASADSSSCHSKWSGMEKLQQAIHRLQSESESWKALLNKHQSKAEELKRKVEQGQEKGVALDTTSMAQSSQHHIIQSKPDYHSLLSRQQPVLHTVAMIMDTQCKMVEELQSIKEQSELLVKETSGRLAAQEGFQDLSYDLIRNDYIVTSATI